MKRSNLLVSLMTLVLCITLIIGATEISIQVKRFTIDENYVDSTLYNFPNKLYYINQN